MDRLKRAGFVVEGEGGARVEERWNAEEGDKGTKQTGTRARSGGVHSLV